VAAPLRLGSAAPVARPIGDLNDQRAAKSEFMSCPGTWAGEAASVLDSAEKLSIAAKSHSSSISDDEAGRIRGLDQAQWQQGSRPVAPARPAGATQRQPPLPVERAILSVKEAVHPRQLLHSAAHRSQAGQSLRPMQSTTAQQAYRLQQPSAAPSAPKPAPSLPRLLAPGKASCRTGQAG